MSFAIIQRKTQNEGKTKMGLLEKDYTEENMYEVLTDNVYWKIKNMESSQNVNSDYVLAVFTFNSLVEQFIKKSIPEQNIKDAIKAIVYMRAYLFGMPHMAYPEDLRKSFFQSCWKFSSCMEEKKQTSYIGSEAESLLRTAIDLEPEVEFLLRTASGKVSAMLSVWEEDKLSHGICTCCKAPLPVINFADCKKKQHSSKLVEEWDLLAVAKKMTQESKDNFGLYKKVSKLFHVYTCEQCGQEMVLLEAYMEWCYENTDQCRPNKELLEWLYETGKEIESASDDYRKKRCCNRFIIDYMNDAQIELDKVTLLRYFSAMEVSYRIGREYYGEESAYYKQKVEEMIEELSNWLRFPETMQELSHTYNLSEQDKEYVQLLKLDLEYEKLGNTVLSFEQFEAKCRELAQQYDKYLGKGNEKSNNCMIRLALSLGEKHNTKEEAQHGIQILLEQLDIMENYNPTDKENIGRLNELIAYIYRENLQNYQYTILFYKQYLKYIEDTYGEDSEYAFGERRTLKEMDELDAKRRRKQKEERLARKKTEKLKRKKFSYSFEEFEEEEKNAQTMLEEILASKRLPNVEELVIGCWGDYDEESAQVIVDGIVEHKEQFQHIKSLFIGDMNEEECEVSWILQADYSKMWEALPNLEKLTIKGSTGLSLGRIEHNHLKELEIICGGLPKSVMHSISNAILPELTSLNLYMGSREYGFDGDIEDIKELLAHPFPKLTKLGLVDSEIQDEITAEVVKSAYMNQISELALSMGTLSDKGGRLLLEEVPKHPNITFLDLEYHYMSAKIMLQLLELPIDVNVDEQQEVYELEGQSYWYPMLTE